MADIDLSDEGLRECAMRAVPFRGPLAQPEFDVARQNAYGVLVQVRDAARRDGIEAAAKVCDERAREWGDCNASSGALLCAAAIRALGSVKP